MSKPAKQLIVCKNFKLAKKLGTGAFGEIYLAVNKYNQSEKYAAKLEECVTKFPQLHFEAKMYKFIHTFGDVKGIPKVHAFTTQGQYNVMLMDLLGKSLEDIFVQQDKRMSIKSVLTLGQQIIDRIQSVHQKKIIHRDIKPDNFLMGEEGKPNANTVYLVDFGLSKKYIKDNQHIPYKEGKQLTGTARYASINTHMGIEQSRRDDIQAIGYMLMYLFRGILPWQNMKANDTKTKYKMIMEKKISTPAEVLCKGFPEQMVRYINYAKNLKFQQKPDYVMLKGLFTNARKRLNLDKDNKFDWSSGTMSKTSIGSMGSALEKQLQKPKRQESQMVMRNDKKEDKYLDQPKYNKPQSSSKRLNETVGSKSKIRQSSKPATKTPGLYGTATLGNINSKNIMKDDFRLLETLGTKIVGPKISVVKR